MIEKNTILSPVQVWQDFDPLKDDTEVSILNYSVENDVMTREFMFTVANTSDGKIRAYVKIVNRTDAKENAPVILVAPGIKNTDDSHFDQIVKDGLIYATFDYAGVNEKHTEYPNSVYYGNYESIENMIEIHGNPKNTCWHLWAVVCRRVITVLCEQLTKPRICLLGVNVGANIGWQVAGMDSRVSCFVAINGSGYIEEMSEYYKPVVVTEDYPTCWLAGVAPQAYAKYVKCPVLYIGGSNNIHSNIDKVQDIMALTSSESKYTVICHNSEKKITYEAYETIRIWVNKFFLEGAGALKETEVSFKNSDGRLYVTAQTFGDDIEKIAVFVSKKETNPAIREWKTISNYTALNNGEYLIPLEIQSLEDRVYCYVNTYYKDGMVLTSKVISVVPSDIDIDDETIVQQVPSRIIYNTSMLDSYFYGDDEAFVFNRKNIIKRQGAFGILGIGLQNGGSLYTFKVGDKKFREDVNATLQMDAYAEKDTTIEIVVYNLEDDELMPYKVSVFLKQCDKWQQILLTHGDFKNYEMISLDTFKNIKKIELKDINSVIFNNIIWV